MVEVKQADYLLPVKANQPKLYRKLAQLAQTSAPLPPDITLNQGHSRHETREVYPFEVTPEQTGFPYAVLAAVVLRTTHHLKAVRVTEETEILISSRPAPSMNAAQIQAFRRGHWSIESLHCVRDVTLNEDASTVRTGHSQANLATFRNLVIGMCALNGARSKKRASCLPTFRRKAQNHRQFAVDLVTNPLLN